jgi:hypothetical protein
MGQEVGGKAESRVPGMQVGFCGVGEYWGNEGHDRTMMTAMLTVDLLLVFA